MTTRFKVKATVIITSMEDLSEDEKMDLALEIEQELNTKQFSMPIRVHFKEVKED